MDAPAHPINKNPDGKTPVSKMSHADHDHQNHHALMAADFRKRFWISLVLTLPILS